MRTMFFLSMADLCAFICSRLQHCMSTSIEMNIMNDNTKYINVSVVGSVAFSGTSYYSTDKYR